MQAGLAPYVLLVFGCGLLGKASKVVQTMQQKKRGIVTPLLLLVDEPVLDEAVLILHLG
jgi:hypothetical protein